jgi:aminoglycoside phosphotransferase (APT) family kinase protein
LTRPTSGYSSETVIVTTSEGARFVVRLALLVPSYPSYDLRVQEAVLATLAAARIPAPRAIALVDHGNAAPFLVMSFVDGRPVGEVPALDPWLDGRGRRVHEQFLTTLATVHRVDWRVAGLDHVLRVGLRNELAYWSRYVDWAADGVPARRLADACAWCARTMPRSECEPSLLWGDARLGNVLYDPETAALRALLDWELATIGPAEMDLAWYLALDELIASFVPDKVAGFLPRAEAVSFYEDAFSRAVVDLEWHEIFALVRSTAINDRQARLAAAAGMPYPGIAGDDNPLLDYLAERISAYVPSS